VFSQQLDNLIELLSAQAGDFFVNPPIKDSGNELSDEFFGKGKHFVHATAGAKQRPI
jgi:hypothetical protein